MGDWVFGCDICQQVCPWNLRFSPLTGDSAFIPRPAIPAPDLRQELGLSQEEFSRKFKESPIKRARRRGYLRNIAVALGNRRDPDALDDLLAALVGDPEPLVRGHCAWALGDIGGQKAHTALEETLEKETDPHVLQEIRWALIACKKED